MAGMSYEKRAPNEMQHDFLQQGLSSDGDNESEGGDSVAEDVNWILRLGLMLNDKLNEPKAETGVDGWIFISRVAFERNAYADDVRHLAGPQLFFVPGTRSVEDRKLWSATDLVGKLQLSSCMLRSPAVHDKNLALPIWVSNEAQVTLDEAGDFKVATETAPVSPNTQIHHFEQWPRDTGRELSVPGAAIDIVADGQGTRILCTSARAIHARAVLDHTSGTKTYPAIDYLDQDNSNWTAAQFVDIENTEEAIIKKLMSMMFGNEEVDCVTYQEARLWATRAPLIVQTTAMADDEAGAWEDVQDDDDDESDKDREN